MHIYYTIRSALFLIPIKVESVNFSHFIIFSVKHYAEIQVAVPCEHYMLEQRRNLVWNNVTTLFQLHFNAVPTLDAGWVGMEFMLFQ